MNKTVPTRESTTDDHGGETGETLSQLEAALADYPYAAACSQCRAYAEDHVADGDRWTVVAATLGHHDSSHQQDPLATVGRF
jgi:hypothetical protein